MNKPPIAIAPVPLKGILLILLAGSCWGFHGVVVKSLFSHGATFLQVFLFEAGLATLFFGCFFKLFFKGCKPSGIAQWAQLLGAGVASIGVGVFLFLSFSLGPIAIGATLLFLYLPQVYFWSAFNRSQAVTISKLTAIATLLIGAVLATNAIEVFREGSQNGAILAGLAASTCYAIVFILTPTLSHFTTVEFRSFTVSCVAFLGCCIILPFQPSLWSPIDLDWVPLSAYLVSLLFIGQVVPIYSIMKGLPMTGSSLGGVLASIELPVAIFSAAAILHESLTSQKLLGVGLVLSGILFYNFSTRGKSKPSN